MPTLSAAFLTKPRRFKPPSNRLPGLADGRAVFVAAFLRAARPRRPLRVWQWAQAYRYVSPETGSPRPGPWSNDVSPRLVEVMDCLSLSDPCETVTAMKAHQLGYTDIGMNLIGSVIAGEPAPIMVVLPTDAEVRKYDRTKLGPTIRATPALRRRVVDVKSRSADGSTQSFKRFEGGFIIITGANSSTGLQMVSVRVLILEEV